MHYLGVGVTAVAEEPDYLGQRLQGQGLGSEAEAIRPRRRRRVGQASVWHAHSQGAAKRRPTRGTRNGGPAVGNPADTTLRRSLACPTLRLFL